MRDSEHSAIGREVYGGSHGRLERARERVADGVQQAVAMGRGAIDGARRATSYVRETKPDQELKQQVMENTEGTIFRAGDALTRMAPSIGRRAEAAAQKLGEALRAISHPTGVAAGTAAGSIGGFIHKVRSDRGFDLPEAEDRSYRQHFGTLQTRPSGMTFEQARPAYQFGYNAARNPSYRGRPVEELDAELERRFDPDSPDYLALCEFARYGYERGSSTQV